MKKKKSSKYNCQTGGAPQFGEEDNQVLNNIPDVSNYFKFIADPRNKELLDQYKKQGYTYSEDNGGNNIKFERPTGEFNLSKGFQFANAGIDLVTGIANKVGDIKDSREEYKRYLESIQPQITSNPNQDGVNSNPIFYQHGGNSVRPIIAEAGEVYQSVEGGISKIPDSMDTHDDASGGVQVNDAFRILEDTGDKRSDIPSKLLRLSPEEVMSITGAKTKKKLTHSKAFEVGAANSDKLTKATEKMLKLNTDTIESSPNDPYAKNSLEFNFKRLDTIPTKGEIFDKLFEHQEDVKFKFNIANPKAKAQNGEQNAFSIRFREGLGRAIGDSTLFSQPPANTVPYNSDYFGDEYKGNLDFYPFNMDREWESGVNPLIFDRYKRNLQPPTDGAGFPPYINNYDFPTPEPAPGTIPPLVVQQNGSFDMRRNVNFPTDDSGLDMVPWELNPNNPQNANNNNQQPQTRSTSSTSAAIPQAPSQFSAPLRWYDVAAPMTSFVDALRRRNVKYNGVQLTAPQAKFLNPLPALQEGQRSYNAALDTLPDNQVGYANAANLFSKKYSIDNQVIGQYDNINNGIWNQNEVARVNTRNSQEQMNQQSREVFDNKIALGVEAQRQQLLRSMSDLTTTIAQNAKLNREGNLLMKLFPNFNQQGVYNGNQRMITNPTAGMSAKSKIALLESQGVKLTPSQKNAILSS